MKLLVVVATAAALSVGPPQGPPPKVSGATTAPPPAWVATASTSRWLAYSSYCWQTTCVDFLPPDDRPDLPAIRVARETVVEFHLRFQPRSLRVTQIANGRRSTTSLQALRTAKWRVRDAGVTVVEARAAAGSASYALRVRLTR